MPGPRAQAANRTAAIAPEIRAGSRLFLLERPCVES
jgi:hypothetical protein